MSNQQPKKRKPTTRTKQKQAQKRQNKRLTTLEKIRFAINYATSGNARESYNKIRPSVSVDSAKTSGLALLKKPEIASYLKKYTDKPDKVKIYVNDKLLLSLLQNQVTRLNEELESDKMKAFDRVKMTETFIKLAEQITKLLERTANFELEEFDPLTEPD